MGYKIEYVVLTNSGSTDADATISVLTPNAEFASLRGDPITLTSGSGGELTASVPPRSALTLKGDNFARVLGLIGD